MTPLYAGLAAVTLLAKLFATAPRLTAANCVVMFWQDVVVLMAFALVERLARGTMLRGATTALIAPYVALVLLSIANVPVTRALGSPITMPMIRATGGALSDSLLYYATPANLAMVTALLVIAIATPLTRKRVWPKAMASGRAWAAAAVVAGALGAIVSRRMDLDGIERNGVVALARTAVARVRARQDERDWRLSPAHTPRSTQVLSLPEGRARERNVLLVVLESTGAQYLKPYGADEDPMPNLTALAARSVVFENAYAAYPESIKGFVALLASRYPAFDVDATAHAALMSPSIASLLAVRGYATALFHSGRFAYLGMDTIVRASGFETHEDAGDIGGNHESSFGIDEEAAVQRVLGWIDSVPKTHRFFATYLPVAGHHPYASTAPGPFADSLEVNRYRNALHEGDVALGHLFDGLRVRGLDTSTVIVVVGDHGEAFGQHEGNYGHTLAIYEENVRVPLMFALPGVPPKRMERVASVVDIAPSILDILGVPASPSFAGASLFAGPEQMALFFTDYSRGLAGLRDGCVKFEMEIESGRSHAFDVCADKAESREVVTPHAAAYREHLARWVGNSVYAAREAAKREGGAASVTAR